MGQPPSTGKCLDQLNPFFIERGLPAEREIGERETSGGTVQVISTSEKSRTRFVCSPLPPFFKAS
jgi:hypothetical protein